MDSICVYIMNKFLIMFVHLSMPNCQYSRMYDGNKVCSYRRASEADADSVQAKFIGIV